jgi:hypothetical protein
MEPEKSPGKCWANKKCQLKTGYWECKKDRVVVQFGGARPLTSRLAGTLAPPMPQNEPPPEIVKPWGGDKVTIKVPSVYKQKFKLEIPGKKIKTGIVLASLWVAASVFADGIWLSSTNSLSYLGQQTSFGSGSITNPYYGDFDYILGHLVPSNTIVHLGEGTFWTKGNRPAAKSVITIPSGVTIQGDGQGVTTIKRSSTFTNVSLTVLGSTNSGISVHDLTVDCNGSAYALNSWTNVIIGIQLTGSGETIAQVTIINGYGIEYSNEGFQMIVGGYGEGDNKVIGCTTSNFLGNYGDGVAPTGDCVVEGNSFYFPVQPAGVGEFQLFGINVCGSAKGSIVIDNYVYGGGDGFHNDTGGDDNLVIANNTFENVCQGVFLAGCSGPYHSAIISHNTMTMQTNYMVYHQQEFLVAVTAYYSGAINQNIVIDGNIMRFYHDVPFTSDGSQGAIFFPTAPGGLNENISVVNNQIDSRMLCTQYGAVSNLYVSGNIPLNGSSIPGLTNSVAGP